MLLIKEKLNTQHKLGDISRTLSLAFETRQKARFIATLDDGTEVGLQLTRGDILRNNDVLRADDGSLIRITASSESVSTVYCKEPRLLARLCYHLGNRHVALQVEANWCRYLHDHVLDDMVKRLGGTVVTEQAPFEPEAGAYAGSAHGHHSHEHYNNSHKRKDHSHHNA